ncbi:sporulation protein YtfJ [Bacillus tianshenii]|uniref:Sporulation protein YtfJ n=1 Tax=Sutcliffiella tianshenii TaxID=1463404 RepID=A0ABS2P1V5_9BACI|nr:GerW family sporulation protein [Bacillus tianshenii]MBM7620593.1 sporulation protein YtfJ [Bacillus tianshenii]MCA1319873.1 GerW family sporulation protein [Bacillus tianshenii]
MSEHPIKSLMTTAMENLKDMIDVNTIIGDPVETPDGSVILTVSKVGFGFAAGGSEFHGSSSAGQEKHDGGNGQQHQSKLPFGGGSGGGVSITPIAFLIVSSSGVKMLHLDESTHLYERILDLAPQAVEKVQQMMKNNKKDQNQHSNHSSYSDHKQDLDF